MNISKRAAFFTPEKELEKLNQLREKVVDATDKILDFNVAIVHVKEKKNKKETDKECNVFWDKFVNLETAFVELKQLEHSVSLYSGTISRLSKMFQDKIIQFVDNKIEFVSKTTSELLGHLQDLLVPINIGLMELHSKLNRAIDAKPDDPESEPISQKPPVN